MAFDVPDYGAEFVERVTQRVDCLISLKLWDIQRDRYEAWKNQFHSETERFFAACVLDSLIYRSKDQFNAANDSLYRGALVETLRPILQPRSDFALVDALKLGNDPGIRLVPVIKANDPPTKSGPLVLRRIQKHLGINDAWTAWPWNVNNLLTNNSQIKAIVFVDDFLGSGNQIEKFLNMQQLPTAHPNVRWIYAPAMAAQEGIDYLAPKFPQLTVVTAERLKSIHRFFSPENWQLLTEGKITADDARAFYDQLLIAKQLSFGGYEYGYSDMELCVGFEHASPDNSLPILWHEDQSWHSLYDPRT